MIRLFVDEAHMFNDLVLGVTLKYACFRLIFTPGISGEYCLWFNYHMFGWHTGGLMFIKESGATSNILWMVHGPQGEEWVQGFTQLVVEPSDKVNTRGLQQ